MVSVNDKSCKKSSGDSDVSEPAKPVQGMGLESDGLSFMMASSLVLNASSSSELGLDAARNPDMVF